MIKELMCNSISDKVGHFDSGEAVFSVRFSRLMEPWQLYTPEVYL